jgi:monoamine oxidase
MALLDTENGAQETRIRGSAHGVSLKLAEQLGEHVRVDSPVAAIHQTSSSVTVSVQGGPSFTCHRVMYVRRTRSTYNAASGKLGADTRRVN